MKATASPKAETLPMWARTVQAHIGWFDRIARLNLRGLN